MIRAKKAKNKEKERAFLESTSFNKIGFSFVKLNLSSFWSKHSLIEKAKPAPKKIKIQKIKISIRGKLKPLANKNPKRQKRKYPLASKSLNNLTKGFIFICIY